MNDLVWEDLLEKTPDSLVHSTELRVYAKALRLYQHLEEEGFVQLFVGRWLHYLGSSINLFRKSARLGLPRLMTFLMKQLTVFSPRPFSDTRLTRAHHLHCWLAHEFPSHFSFFRPTLLRFEFQTLISRETRGSSDLCRVRRYIHRKRRWHARL